MPTLLDMAEQLRRTNQPRGAAEPPDLPPSEAPPGRTLAEMTADQQRIALLALEGFAAQLRGQHMTARAGSASYHELGRLAGLATVTANQLRRYLAALHAA